MNCQSCGARLRDGEKFCRKCGKPVPIQEAGSPRTNRQSQSEFNHGRLTAGNPYNVKKSKIDGRQIALIISGIVVVFAIAAVVLLFAFKNMKENDDYLLGPQDSQEESREEEPETSRENNVILSEAPRSSENPEETPAATSAPKDYREQVISDFERACRIYDQWVRGRTGSTKVSISQEDPETGIQVKDGASYFKLLSEAFSTRYVKDVMDYMGVKRTDSLLMIPEATTSSTGSYLPDDAEVQVFQVTGVLCKVSITFKDSENKERTFYLDGTKGKEHWVFDDLPTEVGVGSWGFFGSYNSPASSATPKPSKSPAAITTPTITTPTPIPSPSAAPTATPTATPTAKPSPSTSPSKQPTPSKQPSPSPSPSPSKEPSPSEEPSPEPSPSEEPSPEPSPSEEPSPEPSPSEEPSPEPSPSEEPSPEPSPSEEPSPEPSPSEEPGPEPSPEEPSQPPVPEVVIDYSSKSASINDVTIDGEDVPVFSSESNPEVASSMNSAVDTLWNSVVDHYQEIAGLNSGTVETEVYEETQYISVLMKCRYKQNDSEELTEYFSVILDKNSGNPVSPADVLSITADEIQGKIGAWQAAVVSGDYVKFYLMNGDTEELPLP